MCLRPDFTLYDAFNIFDISWYKRIEDIDIKDVFNAHNIFITIDEARLIVLRFDRNKDKALTFDEFGDFFVPFDRLSGSALNDRSYRFPNGYYLTPEILDPITKGQFVKVLKLTLEVEIFAEKIRQKHAMRPLFNVNDAFDAINRFKDCCISKVDFAELQNSTLLIYNTIYCIKKT